MAELPVDEESIDGFISPVAMMNEILLEMEIRISNNWRKL